MKKIWLLALLTISAAWLVAGIPGSGAAAGIKAPENEIILAGEKKSARFSHPAHLNIGLDCAVCHHNSDKQPLTAADIEALESSEQLRCASCHNKDFANPELQTFKAVAHIRCKECHKQGVDGKTGPTKCTDCHVK